MAGGIIAVVEPDGGHGSCGHPVFKVRRGRDGAATYWPEKEGNGPQLRQREGKEKKRKDGGAWGPAEEE